MKNMISVRGARENNLKNVNIDLPRDQLVVLTGLSGSGKSSLAFDTIYAEGRGAMWSHFPPTPNSTGHKQVKSREASFPIFTCILYLRMLEYLYWIF